MDVVAPLRAFAELALPRRCAGCGAAAAAVCAACGRLLDAALRQDAWPARPTPCPDGFPPTWTQVPYDGPVAAMLRSFKDAGRVDLAARLGPLLRVAVAAAITADDRLGAAVRDGGTVLLVPMPARAASVRARGREPMLELARFVAAGGAPALGLARVLRVGAARADQAGLDAGARAVNVAGSMSVRRRAIVPAGAGCVLLDDIVTTGSTLAEAARVLRAAGAGAVCAATVAATQRWRTTPAATRRR